MTIPTPHRPRAIWTNACHFRNIGTCRWSARPNRRPTRVFWNFWQRQQHSEHWGMVDYYSILLRAVTAPGAGDAHWRRGIYDRSRQMLSARMGQLEPQAPLAASAGA